MTKVTTDDIFAYYNDVVVPLLALKFAEAGEFYIKILNELRNAFTHVARAQKDPATADEQLRLSKNHLRRAALDCLKVIIIIKAERVDFFIRDTLSEYPLPKSLNDRAHALRKKRVDLTADETRGAIDHTIAAMKLLYGDYDDLWDQLQTEYGTYYHAAISKKRHRDIVKERWIFFGLGIAAALIATLLWENGATLFKKAVELFKKAVELLT